ncbi:hypothetical protein, conserved [Plasmodium gonderi]|uniref:Uncharacterized protein n=1 Tax=Plasmodium gonderi TaxID=77519 RepID=A0A1Y1JIB7_PLAGO|nr:hypothetical protein, conserved [Plasmodium gonderi]GAW80183.1 hypothetical protein, conserved [Plasmodium gonderi]
MDAIKTFMPVVVGSFGLTLSSYLFYKDKKKEKWKHIDGYVDDVVLKYGSNLLQGTFYLNIRYFFYINNEKIEDSKEYKIYVHLIKNKNKKNIETNEYTQNIFQQVSKEKYIKICYNPYDVKQSEPLIYIHENEIISREKLINKMKNKFNRIKIGAAKMVNLDKVMGNYSAHDKSAQSIDEKKSANISEDISSDKTNEKKKKKKKSSSNPTDIQNELHATNNKEPSQSTNKKTISEYDINNIFPFYMFSCSLFLFMSFFLKKRIHFVRKSILEQKRNITKC